MYKDILTSRICEYVTLQDKGDFTGMVEVMNLNWGVYPRLFRCAQPNRESHDSLTLKNLSRLRSEAKVKRKCK